MKTNNLFSNIPETVHEEIFDFLIERDRLKLERIVSHGQATPEGEWYDQDRDEWVILLKGSAGLLFEGESSIIKMGAGDYLNIPAHKKHRVEWTDKSEVTVWLALHYE